MERTPETVIVDASVAVKWFVPEEDSGKALELRERHISGEIAFMAPDLLLYEVSNALRYHKEIGDEELKEDIEALFSLDMDLIQPSRELVIAAAALARRYGITAYDATYLTLAEATSAIVITADIRLFEKIKDKQRVVLLSNTSIT